MLLQVPSTLWPLSEATTCSMKLGTPWLLAPDPPLLFPPSLACLGCTLSLDIPPKLPFVSPYLAFRSRLTPPFLWGVPRLPPGQAQVKDTHSNLLFLPGPEFLFSLPLNHSLHGGRDSTDVFLTNCIPNAKQSASYIVRTQ